MSKEDISDQHTSHVIQLLFKDQYRDTVFSNQLLLQNKTRDKLQTRTCPCAMILKIVLYFFIKYLYGIGRLGNLQTATQWAFPSFLN